eukprot:gb/GFBE01001376.1/.p1 GENE.gb/GFBE01001376.1/~~gb/GFBE01001376.1/.p1  ORF type:complete len:553 (+),score=92.48 gb/GFBE01001376.1/:1-1659(+)
MPLLFHSFLFFLFCGLSGAGDSCKSSTSPSLLQVTRTNEVEKAGARTAASVTMCTVYNHSCVDTTLEGPAIDFQYSPQQVQLIVTRYSEDVRWLDVLRSFPTIVYNKGGDDSLLPAPRDNLQVLEAENVGREDETMLRHVIAQYDNLPEVTVFLQGWPFLHCIGLAETLHRVVAELLSEQRRSNLMPISGTYWQYGVSKGYLGLAASIFQSHSHTGASDPLADAVQMYGDLCRFVLDGHCPDIHWASEGAQWAVRRENLLVRSKQHYEKVVALGEGYESKFRGLVLEGVWPNFWGVNDWSPSSVTHVQPLSHSKSLVINHTKANGTYCDNPDFEDIPLVSCEDTMSYCELKFHQDGQVESTKFVERRSLYQVSETPGTMQATLKVNMRGGATFEPDSNGLPSYLEQKQVPRDMLAQTYKSSVMADKNGLLMLMPSNSADLSPVSWEVTAGPITGDENQTYLISALDPVTSQKLFLACGAYDVAVLVPEEAPWCFDFRGHELSLRSHSRKNKTVLAVSRQHDSYLRCVQAPIADTDNTWTLFYFDLVARSDEV